MDYVDCIDHILNNLLAAMSRLGASIRERVMKENFFFFFLLFFLVYFLNYESM